MDFGIQTGIGVLAAALEIKAQWEAKRDEGRRLEEDGDTVGAFKALSQAVAYHDALLIIGKHLPKS